MTDTAMMEAFSWNESFLDDPLDEVLFDLPPHHCSRGDDLADFLVLAPPCALPIQPVAAHVVKEEEHTLQEQLLKPALVPKKSSKGPALALKANQAPLPAARPVRAARSAPQKQQQPAAKQPKASHATQQQQLLPGNSGSADETDYVSEDGEEASAAAGKTNAANKRPRAPEIDWRAIQDPEERRRQRRLAKNRLTAARSRERKKMILSELETRLQGFEAENVRLQDMLAAMSEENKSLRQQLGQLFEGGIKGHPSTTGTGAGSARADSSRSCWGSCTASTSVKVLLALLLCMCMCNLTGEQLGVALGGAVPVLLLAQLALEEEEGWGTAGGAKRRRTSSSSNSSDSNTSARGNHHPRPPVFDALARLVAALCHTAAHAGPGLQRSIQRMLHARPPRLPKGLFVSSTSSSSSKAGQGAGDGAWPGLPAKPVLRVHSQRPAAILPW